MAETTISDGPRDHPGQTAASKTGSWFQRNRTMAIAIGVVVLVVLFYFLYRNRQASGGSAAGNQSGLSGSTISPADLAGLLSSIPQGPAGAQGPAGPTGATGAPGPQGKPGKPGSSPPPTKHRHKGVPPKNPAVATHPTEPPVNNTTRQARPPVHPHSQKPAVRRTPLGR